MIFGLTTFTLIHVVLSLVGIFAGLVVAGGLVAGKRLDGWTGVFLVTTVATSVTGFGFPFVAFLPSHAVGIISLVVLTSSSCSCSCSGGFRLSLSPRRSSRSHHFW